MAHIYMQFDFATDEEKAQLARHKLEVWKQAFRLDKKLLYKFERSGEAASRRTERGGKAGNRSKTKIQDETGNRRRKHRRKMARFTCWCAWASPATKNLPSIAGWSAFRLKSHSSPPPLSPSRPIDAKFAEMEKRFEELE